MVSTFSIVGMVFTLLLSMAFPIILALWYKQKSNYAVKAVLVGVGVFLVFQVFTRIPLLSLLHTQPRVKDFADQAFFLYALLLSLSAGLFEEIGRYLGFRFLLRDKLQHKNGIAYGIGHGGIEAIALVGFAAVNNLVYAFLINTGRFEETVRGTVPDATADRIFEQLTTLSPWMFFAGGIERFFTLIIQIALSLIVMYSVKKKKISLLIQAIVIHTALNVSALTAGKVSLLFSEIVVGVFAVVAFVYILRSRNEDTPEQGVKTAEIVGSAGENEENRESEK